MNRDWNAQIEVNLMNAYQIMRHEKKYLFL